jgi:hypothetical protein
MLGRSVAEVASSSWDIDEEADPEQPATNRRRTDRHVRAPKDILLLSPKGTSPLSIVKTPLFSIHDFGCAQDVNPRTLEKAVKGPTWL